MADKENGSGNKQSVSVWQLAKQMGKQTWNTITNYPFVTISTVAQATALVIDSESVAAKWTIAIGLLADLIAKKGKKVIEDKYQKGQLWSGIRKAAESVPHSIINTEKPYGSQQ